MPNGADLFQDFSALQNGNYTLSFMAKNEMNYDVKLVAAVQTAIGTPASQLQSLGFLKESDLSANSGWVNETLSFTVNNPGITVNELTFSNSYDNTSPQLQDSKNPAGTFIDIANVSLIKTS
jgi:hypothetical protein